MVAWQDADGGMTVVVRVPADDAFVVVEGVVVVCRHDLVVQEVLLRNAKIVVEHGESWNATNAEEQRVELGKQGEMKKDSCKDRQRATGGRRQTRSCTDSGNVNGGAASCICFTHPAAFAVFAAQVPDAPFSVIDDEVRVLEEMVAADYIISSSEEDAKYYSHTGQCQSPVVTAM